MKVRALTARGLRSAAWIALLLGAVAELAPARPRVRAYLGAAGAGCVLASWALETVAGRLEPRRQA